MFSSFFRSRQWALWAWLGMVVIVGGTYYQVQVDVMINEWFGQFYDMVQKALTTPNAVTQGEFFRGFAELFQDCWHLCCYCNAAKLFLKTLGVSLAYGDE